MSTRAEPRTDREPVARAAADAADRAGVQVRLADDTGDFTAIERLFFAVWGPPGEESSGAPVNREMMRALTYTGGYVAGAFDGSTLVGATVGFFTAPDDRTLHSHITGVARDALGRGVGHALKLHQHAWARAHDLRAITWTFDPLLRRNAYFNVAKLGATPVAYLTDFYGDMLDGVNAGHSSDRLLVSWPVGGLPDHRPDRSPPAATVLLEAGPGDAPARPDPLTPPGPGDAVLVGTPPDIEGMRRTSPALAVEWRAAQRRVLEPLVGHGGRIVGFTRSGLYVVRVGGR